MSDPVAEFAAAQARKRRRTVRLAIAAAVVAAVAVAVLVIAYRDPDVPDLDHPFLWKVTIEGGEPSYLFGTLHVGYGVEDLPSVVLDAQKRCRVTVLESDVLPPESGPIELPPPRPERLEPEVWTRLSKLTGVPEEQLYRRHAIHLVGELLMALAPTKREPMDRGIQRRARKLGKRVEFLLEAAPDDDEGDPWIAEDQALEWVRIGLDNDRTLRAQLREIVKTYGKGIPSASMSNQPLIDELNAAWIDAIDRHVADGGAFIAVGVGHLVGERSIVRELGRRGYEIELVEP